MSHTLTLERPVTPAGPEPEYVPLNILPGAFEYRGHIAVPDPDTGNFRVYEPGRQWWHPTVHPSARSVRHTVDEGAIAAEIIAGRISGRPFPAGDPLVFPDSAAASRFVQYAWDRHRILIVDLVHTKSGAVGAFVAGMSLADGCLLPDDVRRDLGQEAFRAYPNLPHCCRCFAELTPNRVTLLGWVDGDAAPVLCAACDPRLIEMRRAA